MAKKFLKNADGGLYRDSKTGKPIMVDVENKFALYLSPQSANNLYDITAYDLGSITEVAEKFFQDKIGLRSVSLPSTCTSIRSYAFDGCTNLISADMPSVTSVGNSAFYECEKLEVANMPNVISISNYAFRNCDKLTTVDLPNCTTIGESAFYYSGTKTVNIPNVTTINDYAFCGTDLTSVNMPSVITIKYQVFTSCSKLTSLTIPASCISIGGNSLRCGSSKNKVTFTFLGTTPPTIATTTLTASYIDKIIVPKGCGETYKTATNWTTFADYIVEAE